MAYDAGAAFARIERELIESMMRNLRRYHLDWEAAEGFDWSQWQVEQLKYLEEYRKTNVKRFGPQFQSINAAIREAIRRSALQCYVVEGVYPPNLQYLQDNYGLEVNTEDFYVTYDAFASNLPPTVLVTSKK